MKGVVEKMMKNCEAFDAMIAEIEHFEELAFDGKSIAYFFALQSYLYYSSHMLPRNGMIGWLRLQLEVAVGRYENGVVCSLGEAFGIPNRTERKVEALRNLCEERNYPWDEMVVEEFLYDHEKNFEDDPLVAIENLGRELLKRSWKNPKEEISKDRARKYGCKAYLLEPYRGDPTGASAVYVYRDIIADEELKQLVDEIFHKSPLEVVADFFGISASTFKGWYYDHLKIDVYWIVHGMVYDRGMGWKEAYTSLGEMMKRKPDLIRKWYKKGHELVLQEN